MLSLSTFVGGSWVGIVAAAAVVCLVGVLGGHLLIGRLSTAESRVHFRTSVTPYVATAMFALYMGFMAAAIWSENRRAYDTAGLERLALQRLARLAALDEPGFSGLGRAIADYRQAVIEVEWGRDHNRIEAPVVDAAVDVMWSIAFGAETNGTSPGLAADLVAAVDRLEIQRETRLTTGRVHEYDAWMIVFVLCLFSFGSIALAHLDRPSAGRANLVMFAAMSMLTFVFLAVLEDPYDGFALDPSVLEAT